MKKTYEFIDDKYNKIIVRFHINDIFTFVEIYLFKMKAVKQIYITAPIYKKKRQQRRQRHNIYNDYVNSDESHFYFGTYDSCKTYVKKYLNDNFKKIRKLS